MVGSIFRRAVLEETGAGWEEWIHRLDRRVDGTWSHDRIVAFLADEYKLAPDWSEIVALLYEQTMGRVPTGQTASAGVQIGVRRAMPVAKEQAWRFLTSPEGVRLWIGELPSLPLEAGQTYRSEEGTFGQMRVVVPFQKLRLTWQRRDWDNPSTLQMYLLSNRSGTTTISFHQEKLDDIYMRELMRRHWEDVLDAIRDKLVR